MKAQLDFAKFLRFSFILSLLATLVLSIVAFINLAEWQENRLEEQRVDQQQVDIMNNTFAVLSTQSAPDENALQAVFDQYQKELQHIAVFAAEAIEDAEDAETWQKGPSTRFPIDYAKASIVVGENGKITDAIVPNDYDIGTMVMAKGKWVVQFEYKEFYLATVENAFQIKHFSPEARVLFSFSIAGLIITLLILGSWQYQKRIMKPMKDLIN